MGQMESGKIFIGTSGYSYRDWIGPFYPSGLRQEDMLAYYAQEFAFNEINFSYYRLPEARTLACMARKVPKNFLFTIKAYQSLTHQRGDSVPADAQKFRAALQPLVEEGKLGAILLQFPYSFHNDHVNRSYLRFLRELFPDQPLVVEFRHSSWLKESIWQLLNSLDMGYVCVDGPRLGKLVTSIVKVTSSVAYARFHGRNVLKWWDHKEAYERYDYLYSEKELAEWVPRVSWLSRQASRVFVAFNNHFGAQAVQNARMFRALLGISGYKPN